MESIAYIVALCVGVAVMAWYVANEARGADGTFGFLAIGGGAGDQDAGDEPLETSRYRIRPRLTPKRGAGSRSAAGQKAYRVKAPERLSYRINDDENAEADKEY
jgi:hypothetical protein